MFSASRSKSFCPQFLHHKRTQHCPAIALSPLLTGSIAFASISVGVNSCVNSYSTYSMLRRQPSAAFTSLHPPVEVSEAAEEQKPGVSRSQQKRLELAPTVSQLLLPHSAAALGAQNDQLVTDLDRLLQDQKKILPSDDSTRHDQLANKFHHKFVPWLQETLQKRPAIADEIYCKARCEEPTFREGYQHGVSMCLSVLGRSIRQYHATGMSVKARKEYMYPYGEAPEFTTTKSGGEMLDPQLGAKKLGRFHA